MDSQDRLIALDDTMDSETLQHYGVKGMKWGVRRARKSIDRATVREQLWDTADSLEYHKAKTTKKIAKLEKKGAKYQSVYEKRVERDAQKSARLETKSAKLKRKATRRFITDGRSKELLLDAQKLDAKVSTLDARVKSAKAKIDKNQIMLDTFKKGLKDIDDLLVETGKKYVKVGAEYDNPGAWRDSEIESQNKRMADYAGVNNKKLPVRSKTSVETERQGYGIKGQKWGVRDLNKKKKKVEHSELSEDDYIAAEFEINSKYLKQFNTAKTLQEKDWIEHSWENELDELYHYEDDELYHYGVKGMKWGVRKAKDKLSKAKTPKEVGDAGGLYDKHFRKASKKAKKLKEKQARLQRMYDQTGSKRIKARIEKNKALIDVFERGADEAELGYYEALLKNSEVQGFKLSSTASQFRDEVRKSIAEETEYQERMRREVKQREQKIDKLNKQYDEKMKNAKTPEERDEIEFWWLEQFDELDLD